MKAGDKVKLTGKTKHGKNRVREQGQDWIVVKTDNNLEFADSREQEFALLRAEERPHEHWRWVAVQNDKNFLVEVLTNDNEGLEGV